MSKNIDFLALLSSDRRPKYLEDIYACLALPKGASYRFRYDASYLPPAVKEAVKDEYVGPISALVCFRGNFVKNGEAIVPVRWVQITRVKRVLDFYVFYFELGDFPKFNSQFSDGSGTALTACSKDYLSQIPQGLRQLPVVAARMGYVSTNTDYGSETWLRIVRTLSMHSAFSGLHFVRLSGEDKLTLVRDKGQTRFRIDAGSYVSIDVEFYSEEFNDDEMLELSGDETIIRFANGRSHRLGSRYDLLPILVEAKHVEAQTDVDVFFRLSKKRENVEFEFSVPLRVRRPFKQFFVRMIVPTAGGLMLASRSFFGGDADPILVGAVIVVGALLIGAGVASRR
ncbi:MAG: hypothetical protein AAFQ79_09155 [Pseudomonadota bacterium]